MWGRDAHVVLPLAPHLSLRVPREARQSSSCWRMILRACSGMSAGRVAKGRRGGRCGTWTYETARWQRVGRGPAHPAARKEGGGGIAGGWREAGPTLVELACAPRECCSLAGSCARKLPAEGANHGLPAVSKAVPSRVRCADPGIGGCPNLPVSDSPLCNRSRDQMPAAMGGGWFQLVSSPFQLFPFSRRRARCDRCARTACIAERARSARASPVPLGRANMDRQPFPGTRSPRLLCVVWPLSCSGRLSDRSLQGRLRGARVWRGSAAVCLNHRASQETAARRLEVATLREALDGEALPAQWRRCGAAAYLCADAAAAASSADAADAAAAAAAAESRLLEGRASCLRCDATSRWNLSPPARRPLSAGNAEEASYSDSWRTATAGRCGPIHMRRPTYRDRAGARTGLRTMTTGPRVAATRVASHGCGEEGVGGAASGEALARRSQSPEAALAATGRPPLCVLDVRTAGLRGRVGGVGLLVQRFHEDEPLVVQVHTFMLWSVFYQ